MSHLKALFEGQELSEEFKSKAQAIVEAAVEEKVSAQLTEREEVLKEEYQTKTETRLKELEEISEKYIQEEVLPNVDKYLSAAVTEWLEDNKVQMEASAKVELAESFLTGLVGLAEGHNLKFPEGKDVVTEMQTKIDEMKDRLNGITEENVDLKQEIVSFKKKSILESVSVNLTESQKEKFESVVSKLEFKTDEQFHEAVKSLLNSYFPVNEDDKEDEDEDEELEEKKKKDMKESTDPYLSNLFKQLNS